MSQPLEVDTDALAGVARELAALSDQLNGSVHHETQPPVDQPTGPATSGVTAAANHVVTECAANLLLFADNIARAVRYYEARDAEEAGRITDTIEPPR